MPKMTSTALANMSINIEGTSGTEEELLLNVGNMRFHLILCTFKRFAETKSSAPQKFAK